MSVPVPLLMAIELLAHHDDDRMEHLVRVGVVGVPEPLTVRIESDFYKWPRIAEIETEGGISLPTRLRDLLIFKVFEILAPELDGTDIAELPMADATRWIQTVFLDAEAAILLTELRRHVTPGLVVDPARCTAFTPVPMPPADPAAEKGPSHE